jgi:lambda repressor-like predicted transcriptional regulator
MKCPNCGYSPKKGRPKKLDDKEIKALAKTGWSLQALATTFGVTRGAIQASLKRSK